MGARFFGEGVVEVVFKLSDLFREGVDFLAGGFMAHVEGGWFLSKT